jgi:hypothetical protein
MNVFKKWLRYGVYELVAFVILLVPWILGVSFWCYLYKVPSWGYGWVPVVLLLIISRFVRWGSLVPALAILPIFPDLWTFWMITLPIRFGAYLGVYAVLGFVSWVKWMRKRYYSGTAAYVVNLPEQK